MSIGDGNCVIASISDAEIQCIVGANGAGSHLVRVTISGKGYSNQDMTVKYKLQLSSISSLEGFILIFNKISLNLDFITKIKKKGSYGGGLEITIGGDGFSNTTIITICEKICAITSVSSSQISFIVSFCCLLSQVFQFNGNKKVN